MWHLEHLAHGVVQIRRAFLLELVVFLFDSCMERVGGGIVHKLTKKVLAIQSPSENRLLTEYCHA
jgi:hypothetical protein